ncbi:hypothetical protein CASFOL_023179 [Castilleja foliolosa]|uniref:VQ domain-containing protein n=1 Tax=Castilleja foliolosa TaxID=1961234 RepID=A0ABD3CJT6_9LAMI
MDSGHSGSLQSSSGGDEEYDSRADSVSAFMSGGPISNPPPPFFDPLSNYLQLHQTSSLIDPDPAWPRMTTAQSDPIPVTHDILTPNINMPSFNPPPATCPTLQNQSHTAARNPKKRSRASRRAPTTVLTTDTTNFRSMVQEFTGIPAPPFDSSSFPRTRLDLFGSRSAASSDAPPPPYLRRPFAQKVQPPLPFLAPTSAIGASSSTSNNNNNSSNPAISLHFPFAQSSSNSSQNQFLTHFLQTNPKFPISKTGLFPQTQFDLSHRDNNFIPSNQVSLQKDDNSNTDKDKDDGNDGGNLRTVNNSAYNFPSSSSNSKTTFHHDGGKMSERNVAGEGMVESWICSSE